MIDSELGVNLGKDCYDIQKFMVEVRRLHILYGHKKSDLHC